VTLQAFRQTASADWVQRRDILNVAPTAAYIVITCEVIGTRGSAYFDEVSLTAGIPSSWLEGSGLPDPATAPLQASVSVFPTQVIRAIPSTLYGSNLEWIEDGDGVWNASSDTLDTSILGLTQTAGTTLLRFPGGVLSDFYSWRDGIGPQAGRPQTLNVAGGSLFANDFGTDEALAFAQGAGGRLLITVNVVTGTPQEAAAWVSYVNTNHHRVDYWELGNESYVNGTVEYQAAAAMTPEVYAGRVLAFAQAMRAADPTIKIGAITDENSSVAAVQSYPDWTERMLKIAGNAIDFVSVHAGYAPGIAADEGWMTRTVYASMLASPTLLAARLADLANRIDQAVPSRAGQIPIAMTEWGPYFQTSPSGRFLDHTKTLGSALFVASTLKTMIESPRTFIATAFKLVDSAYLGWIGIRQGAYVEKPSLLALEMFTQHFGAELVQSSTTAPVFDSPSIGWADAAQAEYLDVVCSTNASGDVLYILAINKNFDRPVQTQIQLNGFAAAGTGTAYSLSALATDSNTGTELPSIPGLVWASPALFTPLSEFNQGNPGAVVIEASPLSGMSEAFSYTFPPHSITSLAIGRR
jgi:alpha-N-arabinofuranosidase